VVETARHRPDAAGGVSGDHRPHDAQSGHGRRGRPLGRAAQGIVRVTRHPFLIGVALWALVHHRRRRWRFDGVLRDLRRSCAGRDGLDRRQAPAVAGCRAGARCRGDLDRSVCRSRRWTQPLPLARDRPVALAHRLRRLCADAGRQRAGDRRLAFTGVRYHPPRGHPSSAVVGSTAQKKFVNERDREE
jgi:hypothetical protein